MFDLSKRIISAPSTSTPQKVGPSTYFLESDKHLKKNYVPFLTNSQRTGPNNNVPSTEAVYNACIEHRIKGGGSMASKAPRFKEAVDDGLPGPCAYNPKRPGKRVPREIVGKGRVYNCRTIYNLYSNGSSIPTKLDENGYMIDENDKLVKIPPNKYDHSLGPAYYAAPQTKCYNSERYKGCRWSLSKTKRIDNDDNEEGPGPATYSPETRIRCTMNNPQDIEFRALARQFSFMPRFLEIQEMSAKRENYPAPCDYDTNTSTFKLKPTVSIKARPFLNAASRFGASSTNIKTQLINDSINNQIQSESGTPGPGCYNVKYPNSDRKTFSIMKAPFNSLASRVTCLDREIGPGPANYNVLGQITSNLMRGKCRDNPLVPFNKTSQRKLNSIHKDQFFMPSPADYVVEPLWNEKKRADSSQFKTNSQRTMIDVKPTDDANAATYNISEPFRENNMQRSHYRGRAPFHQSRGRGSLFPTTFGPGPGDYPTETPLGGRGYFWNTTPRFRDESETPGPATYKINPTIASSVHKANTTQNIRLKEFVLHKKLRLPPNETFARWCRTIKKRKNLRWFYEYDMSLPKIKDYIKEEFDDKEY